MNNFEKWKAGLTLENMKIHDVVSGTDFAGCIDCDICPAREQCIQGKSCYETFKEWGEQDDNQRTE